MSNIVENLMDTEDGVETKARVASHTLGATRKLQCLGAGKEQQNR